MSAVELAPGQVRKATIQGRPALITIRGRAELVTLAGVYGEDLWAVEWDAETLRRNPGTRFAETLPGECLRPFPLARQGASK